MTVPHHALTAAQFDGLAAGYGSPDAVRVLREGQLTKRKLLLQALMEATGPASPAMDLLIRADEADRDATAELLWHPHLDVWAGQALRTGEGTGYLAQVAAAAGVRAGLPFRLEVPVTHGEVYLPGLGALAHEGATAVVTPDTVGAEGWEPLRTAELEPGYAVAIEDLEPYRDCYHWRPAPRLDEATADHFAGLLREAWQIITRRHPGHADAMRILLRSIVPLATPSTGGNVSAASRQASGSVAVVIPATAEELCLLLIHEFMHMKLDALRDLVDLHHPGGEPRFLAPWRMDPRPVGPLFQGVYAHTGVTDYWRLRRAEPDAPPAAVVEFGYWRHQNWLAVGALSDSGELTPRANASSTDSTTRWPPGRTRRSPPAPPAGSRRWSSPRPSAGACATGARKTPNWPPS
ncbi:hypothetical protein Asp14428_44590 [Actinoplanes sp. NBRC 14428]|nr:hypothetical protein Asp14428_44590 [Actinoplanes sp. NBRC 14428]